MKYFTISLMLMKSHVDIKVIGKVQGVFFRRNTKEIAEKLELKGFVQNRDDGTVQIEVEGEESRLQAFIRWCRKGPDLAKVTRIEAEHGEIEGFTRFEIKPGYFY